MPLLSGKEILYAVLLLLYNASIFTFIDTLLENRRINKNLMWGVYVFNMIVFVSLFLLDNHNVTLHYSVIIVCLFIELLLLYKETILRILFVTLAVTLHIMIIRAAALGAFSIIYNVSPYDANHSVYALDSLNVALVIMNVTNLLVRKFIPARSVKIINQHKEQLVFMTTWLIFANIYFLFNSLVFTSLNSYLFMKINIIAVAYTMILALYTVLIFTFRVGQLLGYKEKSDHLENIVEDGKQFKNSVVDQAILGYEVNLTQDLIISGFGSEFEARVGFAESYNDMVTNSMLQCVHEDDLQAVINFMDTERLLGAYQKGELEQVLDYRGLPSLDQEYKWCRVFFNLYKASATDNIMAFCYVKDIDVEKRLEIEIKNRSERDTLTGLYNHGMTKQLVNGFIANQNKGEREGALFIIDVDNFKLINDNFGHGFGDEVLHEISDKLLGIFRGNKGMRTIRNTDDIVGRIGGDEFMVFVKTSNISVLEQRAQTICDMLQKTFTTPDGKKIVISASVGIALVESAGDDFKTLYAKADSALYASKRRGKNVFSFYDGKNFEGYEGIR